MHWRRIRLANCSKSRKRITIKRHLPIHGRHLAGFTILVSVRLGGKCPVHAPADFGCQCKSRQSPRYPRPFLLSTRGKFPAYAPPCPGPGGAGVYIDWCIISMKHHSVLCHCYVLYHRPSGITGQNFPCHYLSPKFGIIHEYCFQVSYACAKL